MARILVIEDNPVNLALVDYLLRHAGHEVVPAATGEAGLALAWADPPALVLCDLQLPGLDGYGVLAALRAAPITAAVPVVALTAFSMSLDRERVNAAGFDGYLTKPIEPEGFIGQVAVFLRQASTGD